MIPSAYAHSEDAETMNNMMESMGNWPMTGNWGWFWMTTGTIISLLIVILLVVVIVKLIKK